MNFKNLFFAAILVFGFSACRDTASAEQGHEHEGEVEAHGAEEEEHGHPHNADGSHMEGEHTEQEEFKVGEDSLEVKEETGHHTHEEGSTHHDH